MPQESTPSEAEPTLAELEEAQAKAVNTIYDAFDIIHRVHPVGDQQNQPSKVSTTNLK